MHANAQSAVWITVGTQLVLVWVLTESLWDFLLEVGFWAAEPSGFRMPACSFSSSWGEKIEVLGSELTDMKSATVMSSPTPAPPPRQVSVAP